MNELEYFIGTVAERRSRIFEDDGRYVLKTALAAVRSYREGRLVGVEWVSYACSFMWWIFYLLGIYLDDPMHE